MLPIVNDKVKLSADSRERLAMFEDRFMIGENGQYNGMGHIIYACHVAFPLLITPELANLIWLNFKGYRQNNEAKTIRNIAVSDFLLSPLVRQVATGLFEVIPDIRTYLLYLLSSQTWFGMKGVEKFGVDNERLLVLAEFLKQYIATKASTGEKDFADFKDLNDVAWMAYLKPGQLTLKMAKSLQQEMSSSDRAGVIRLNAILEKVQHQYSAGIYVVQTNAIQDIKNLTSYSRGVARCSVGEKQLGDLATIS
ncbi:MAG: hypothetical protein WDO15_06175 [Bacteroidota bacterium]